MLAAFEAFGVVADYTTVTMEDADLSVASDTVAAGVGAAAVAVGVAEVPYTWDSLWPSSETSGTGLGGSPVGCIPGGELLRTGSIHWQLHIEPAVPLSSTAGSVERLEWPASL